MVPARAALACLKFGLSTLVFCPSRIFAEAACRVAKRDAEEFELDPEVIVPYRAGYTPDERRSIEKRMRTGECRIVFSTSALEMGIDVGGLDACLLVGYPGTVMSTWQAFRAGIEGTISGLKRAFRLSRCLYRGFKGFASAVGLGVFSHNLVVLARMGAT
jgi:DEAD/DEAH box helicase domain-containing protein